MNGELTTQISMLEQQNYNAAVEKYGQEFADAVVSQELQLYADNLDCFDEYATYDWMQEFIQGEERNG